LTISEIKGDEKGLSYYADLAKEDYYERGGEPPARWYNGEAVGRTTGSVVARMDYMSVMHGRDPESGRQLVQLKDQFTKHRYGWDCTFSAPKSVSAVWAAADDELRKKITEIHESSVVEALDFMSECAGRARRGKGGATLEEVKLVGMLYRHSTSRELEPHLHTHALVANLARRDSDGTYGGIEGACLYDWKMAGGAAYRAALFRKLSELGVGLEPDAAHPDWGLRATSVTPELEKHWSTRHDQIVDELRMKGMSSREAETVALRSTRKAKEGEVSHAELFREWKSEAAHFGLTSVPLLQSAARNVPEIDDPEIESLTEKESTFRAQDVFAKVLNHGAGTWSLAEAVQRAKDVLERRDVLFQISGAPRDQRIFTTKRMARLEREIAEMADRRKSETGHVLSSPATSMKLSFSQRRIFSALTTHPGGVVAVEGRAGTGKSYTMAAVREAYEREGFRVLGASFSGKAAEELERGSGIKSRTLDSFLIRARLGLVKLDDRTVLVLDESGMAGSRHVHRLLKIASKAGAKVILVGDTKQLQPIQAGSGHKIVVGSIEAETLEEIRRQKPDWVVVGEDALAEPVLGTRVEFTRNRNEFGVKKGERAEVVDIQNISSLGSSRMVTLRFDDGREMALPARERLWHAEAAKRIAHGEMASAMKEFDRHGCLDASGRSAEEARERLVKDWWKNKESVLDRDRAVSGSGAPSPSSSSVMLAYRRTDVLSLNLDAREKLKEGGYLRETTLVSVLEPTDGAAIPGDRLVTLHTMSGVKGGVEETRYFERTKEFGVGDEVLFGLNDTTLEVKNGQIGRIVGIRTDGPSPVLSVRMQSEDGNFSGRTVDVDTSVYRHMDWAYATTVHKAQGATVDRAYVFMTEGMTQELAYVASSRARWDTRFYLPKDLLKTLARTENEAIDRRIGKSQAKIDEIRKQVESGTISTTERTRLEKRLERLETAVAGFAAAKGREPLEVFGDWVKSKQKVTTIDYEKKRLEKNQKSLGGSPRALG